MTTSIPTGISYEEVSQLTATAKITCDNKLRDRIDQFLEQNRDTLGTLIRNINGEILRCISKMESDPNFAKCAVVTYEGPIAEWNILQPTLQRLYSKFEIHVQAIRKDHRYKIEWYQEIPEPWANIDHFDISVMWS
jgi:hypothetical protein